MQWRKRRYSNYLWWPEWDPTGQRIAASFVNGVSSIFMLDKEGNMLRRLKGHRRGINCVAWNNDGARIATASWDRSVKIWGLEGNVVFELKGFDDSAESVDWAPNGEFLVTASRDKKVKLWKHNGRLDRVIFDHEAVVYRALWNPVYDKIAIASEDNTVYVIDTENGTKLHLVHPGSVFSLDWSSDGQCLATGCQDSVLRLWNAKGELLKEFPKFELKEKENWLIPIAWSPNGSLIATGYRDGNVRIWKRAGELLQVIGHDRPVIALAWCPRSPLLTCGCSRGVLETWNLQAMYR